MCMDYRRLNAGTVRDAFPIPNLHEMISTVAPYRVFSLIDLFSAYHQVPVAEESKHLLAFITKRGLYEWNVMPFGPIPMHRLAFREQ